jgi:hypothetical protein
MRKLLFLTPILVAQLCMAQAPAGAPAGSTAQCKDGSYFSGASKSGACRGHQGVKTWWGPAAGATAKTAPAKAPAAPVKTATAPSPAPAPAPAAAPAKPASTPAASSSKSSSASKTQAPGGGPGLVWVNTSTKVYHCSGSQYYGKTKAGAYMSEADAKAKGAKPDAGKPCK